MTPQRYPAGDADLFGTAALRGRVLDAWRAAPERFREDANAEEDLALGGYRDRIVVELAQNAADAARRAGRPGRLLLTLRDRVLVAANTGTPLDAAGVAAASTLRASAKRDEPEAVGRFGVGFAAVAAVTDEPHIASRTGAVRWSLAETRELAGGIPGVAEEMARRRGHVPLLRLPFPSTEEPPPGFDTAVVLPLRDDAADRLVRRLLADVSDTLLLALPGLGTVEVATDSPEGPARTLRAERRDDTEVVISSGERSRRWRTARASGRIRPALLADRPTEERERPYWSVLWAVPVDADGRRLPLPPDVPPVIHAPTPSDERLGLPALLIASFPLAPDRRHVAAGPLTEELVEHSAAAYRELLQALPPTPLLLDLVPGPAAEGELDAKLRRAVNALLPDTAFLPTAASAARQRPRDALLVAAPAAVTEVLAPVLAGLLPADWPVRDAAWNVLGVRRMTLADVVDAVADLNREPTWWHALYAAMDVGAATDTEALGTLPVPLADGRLVRGPRGLLLPAGDLDVRALAPLGLRFVHPDAAHPLLRRLGAIDGRPRAVLDHPRTRAAVAASYDEDDPEPVAEAVLRVVAAADVSAGESPWLADLALAGDDGEVYPAGELVLPGSTLDRVLAEDAPVGTVAADLVERFGTRTLEAVGVAGTFTVVREPDVPLDPAGRPLDEDVEERLDEVGGWMRDALSRLPEATAEASAPPLVAELAAVADLDLVDPDRWEDALAMLSEPPLRRAVVEPALVVTANGDRVKVPSYTAWWLRRHRVLAGRRPGELRTPDADETLATLYDPAPVLDAELARALGVHSSLQAVLAEPGGPDDVLARLTQVDRTPDRRTLRRLLAALAAVDPDRVTPPDRVPAVLHGRVTVVPADDAVVVDAPDLLPLVRARPVLLVPYRLAEALADVLDVRLASEAVAGRLASAGRDEPVPEAAIAIVPGCPRRYRFHDRLVVDGQEVAWRYAGGVAHASGTAGLARALAWVAGRWEARLALEAALRDPGRIPDLLAETDLEDTSG